MITLLEHGFRFLETYESSSSQPSYNIMFLRHINGESVDWTYGAALYEGKNPIPKQVSGFLLFVVLAVLLFFVLLLIFSNRNGSNERELSLFARTKNVLRSNSTNSSHSVNSASEFSCCCSFCESGTRL